MWVTFCRNSAILYLKKYHSWAWLLLLFTKAFRYLFVWYGEEELGDLSFYSRSDISHRISRIQVSADLVSMVSDTVKWHCESNLISRCVIVPRVKSTDLPSHKFANYTRILGTCCLHSPLAFTFPISFSVSCKCTSKARQIWQYWKGNIPKVLLEEVLMLCSFLPTQFQSKSPHKQDSKSSELAVTDMPATSIFTRCLRSHGTAFHDKFW